MYLRCCCHPCLGRGPNRPRGRRRETQGASPWPTLAGNQPGRNAAQDLTSVISTRPTRAPWLPALVFCAGVSFSGALFAQTLPFVNSIQCTIVPISPSLPGLTTVTARGLSEPGDPDVDGNATVALAGQCDTWPILQPGIPPIGAAWAVQVPPTTAVGGYAPIFQIDGYFLAGVGPFFDRPTFTAPLALPTLPLTGARYGCATGAALNGGLAPAEIAVRAGYTVQHLPTGLRYHAASWVLNAAGNGYLVNDLDPTSLYVSSRVYGIVQQDGGALLAFGCGANTNGHGFTPEQPIYWTLDADGTILSGPVQPTDVAGLSTYSGRDMFVYGASPRADILTFVGSGSATLSGYPSTWATFWQAIGKPVNLNDPANNTGTILTAPVRGPNNPNAGGAAYAVGEFPDGKFTDDIVAGMVQQYTVSAGRSALRTRACVWLSDRGGGPDFQPVLMPLSGGAQIAPGAIILNSLARGAAGVSGGGNINAVAVGSVSFRTTAGFQGWRGFLIKAAGTPAYFNITAASDGGLSNFARSPWVVTGIKAINRAGWMLGTAHRGFAADQDVLLIPNGGALTLTPDGGTPGTWLDNETAPPNPG
jgi:hypothetical protein